jgi:anti-sigma regulatory factor (Ser/Thr protein kinase)
MPTRTFPARHKALAKLGEFVGNQASKAGLDKRDAYAVKLAVDEAAANIIEHAYGGEGQGEIECVCTISEDKLEVVLKDRGKAFVPDEIPELPAGLPLEDYGPGGAGLMLMKRLMDEVKFEFREGQNVVKMVKRKQATN